MIIGNFLEMMCVGCQPKHISYEETLSSFQLGLEECFFDQGELIASP